MNNLHQMRNVSAAGRFVALRMDYYDIATGRSVLDVDVDVDDDDGGSHVVVAFIASSARVCGERRTTAKITTYSAAAWPVTPQHYTASAVSP